MHLTASVTLPPDEHEGRAHETEEFPVITLAELPRASFVLRVVTGPDVGRCLAIEPGTAAEAFLGQAEGSGILLSDPHVSRKHVSIMATPTHLVLVDLGSRNGTKVNGVLVREARLYGGELVAIGSTTLVVELECATAANHETSSTSPPAPASATRSTEDDFFTVVLADRLPFTEARQRTVAEFERRYVEDCLQRHNGNVTHAARASGLAHRYFQLVRARSREPGM